MGAMPMTMGQALVELCYVLSSQPPSSKVRCVVLTGSGRAFSTGRDLKDSLSHTVEERGQYLNMCLDSANALATIPVPTIAAINGPCFGWGLEAALACDIRLATQTALLCFPET